MMAESQQGYLARVAERNAQVEKARMLLDDLAWRTPEEIADLMRVQGVRGECGKAQRCVLAQYIRQNGVGVLVSGIYVHVRGTQVPTPDSVMHFIGDFDTGHYPDLIAKESES